MSQPAADLVAGSRTALSRAITLVESTRADHRLAARALLAAIAEHAGGAVRVGISGTPGVGKSTFIEALGTSLTTAGHRVGVLAVDPSSVRTGGSVLGDKTRMPQLAADPDAYIRPSPTAGTLGGVARATAQTITLLEAGGYDVVLVETVGVGQSETTVAGMVDTFLLLGLARAGDQLQGIKKGVLEIADVVAINKADGEHALAARAAARELAGALRLVHSGGGGWVPPVLTCSALTGDGVTELWATVEKHRAQLGPEGLAAKRSAQQWELTWALVRDELDQRLRRSAAVSEAADALRGDVLTGRLPAAAAADAILTAYDAPLVGADQLRRRG
ncbi:MAG TPA: methylmalonyl Co-A mutase-associated GTPase MeaB [Nakamurella sp.]